MLEIDNTLISVGVLEANFACVLDKCKGICCVEGDAGAPLELEETIVLENIFENIKPFLRPQGVAAIEKQGAYVTDEDGDLVTPLINGKECAYTIFSDNGIAGCGIEKAYAAGATDFQKPISCHLYPIRLHKVGEYIALNYHQWEICNHACKIGEEKKVSLISFLEEPLIRRFGKKWYDMLLHFTQSENSINHDT